MAVNFSGGTYRNQTFTGDTKWAIMQNILQNLATGGTNAGWTNNAVGGGLGPANVGTVTITIASPGVVTFTGHGFLGGEPVVLATTGALPTALSVNTKYFVKFIDANTFNLATTLGGTNINTSGSQSGTHTLYTQTQLLQSAAQSTVTNPIIVKVQDNLGSCVTISIQNQAGSLVGGNSTTAGGMLLPASAQSFRIIATKYHFLCFYVGAQSGPRQFVMAGMLYVPSFVQISGATVSDHGYMFGAGNSDTDSTAGNANGFRHLPNIFGRSDGTVNTPNIQFIWGANILENANNANAANSVGGFPTVLAVLSPFTINTNSRSMICGYRWTNDDINTADMLLSIGLTAFSDEGKVKGQFYDMIYIADAFAIDSTDTFNGHTWLNLTNNNAGANGIVYRGGVWVATS